MRKLNEFEICAETNTTHTNRKSLLKQQEQICLPFGSFCLFVWFVCCVICCLFVCLFCLFLCVLLFSCSVPLSVCVFFFILFVFFYFVSYWLFCLFVCFILSFFCFFLYVPSVHRNWFNNVFVIPAHQFLRPWNLELMLTDTRWEFHKYLLEILFWLEGLFLPFLQYCVLFHP